jgi:UDPglucose 6-dehydrogenase
MAPKIAIIGMGHVGTATHELLRNHADLITYDTAHDRSYPQRQLAACDAAIICVDTPMSKDGPWRRSAKSSGSAEMGT